jgi:hypothetical protein
MKARFPTLLAMLAVALLGLFLIALQPSTAAVPTNPDPWPRRMQITGGTLTVYQPQVDSWDGGFLKFRAAVAVKPSDGGQEVFGVIRASAHTLVDRTARMVSLFNFSLLQIDFPPCPITASAITPISAGCFPAPRRGFPSTACRGSSRSKS